MKKLFTVLMLSLLLIGCEKEVPVLEVPEGSMDHSMMIQSDEEFLAMMIPHHQEAIDTSKVILEKSENEELKTLAQGIVDAQTAEIAQMETWAVEWFGEEFSLSNYELMMPELSYLIVPQLEGEELDQAYIRGMIEHHEGAVQMAEELKMVTERPELLEMADNIIEAQTTEIELLKSWLN